MLCNKQLHLEGCNIWHLLQIHVIATEEPLEEAGSSSSKFGDGNA